MTFFFFFLTLTALPSLLSSKVPCPVEDKTRSRISKGEARTNGGSSINICARTDNWWEVAVEYTQPSLALCDDLEGQDGRRGGRLEREGIYVYLQLIHIAVRQKPTKHHRAIFLQLKTNKRMSKQQLWKQYSVTYCEEQNCLLPNSLCPTPLGRRGSAWSDGGCLMHVMILGK